MSGGMSLADQAVGCSRMCKKKIGKRLSCLQRVAVPPWSPGNQVGKKKQMAEDKCGS